MKVKEIDINSWDRKQHYEHFIKFKDPYFGVVVPFDVTTAYHASKTYHYSFFGRYLHDCMKAVNTVEPFKYRIKDEKVIIHDVIHASATIMRTNKTFGCSFINFNEDLKVFLHHLEIEKQRIQNSNDLFPPQNGSNCIHCSALPWVAFTGHKEPVSGMFESVPKLGFSKLYKEDGKLMMNVSIDVNHALMDGYHVGLFSEKFQDFLNA
ncbi:chloramphenicol acetyltransferase [Flavobacteriaceae bacterium MHTCC 0001]